MSDDKMMKIKADNYGRLIDAPDEVKDAMNIKTINVISPRYHQVGVVCNNGITRTLFFMDGDKEINMGIESDLGRSYDELAGELIDAYFDKKKNGQEKPDKVSLHYWYFRRVDNGVIANGIVSGHPKLTDSMFINTSLVMDIKMGEGELLVQTMNTLYHLPLEYCNFRKQDNDPDVLEGYEKIKEEYQGKIVDPTIEDDKFLLVISNFDDYYCHSAYYKGSAENEPREFNTYAHVSMTQDSYLIHDSRYEIDVRYFPHYGNIEFYSERTGEAPFFVENIGTETLYVKAHCGIIRLDPGDRKEVCKDNTEDNTPPLARGDLYPAGVMW